MKTNLPRMQIPEPVALLDSERQPCEVWTRVMGYHRPVASFNIGKKGEHNERRFFRECDRAIPRGSAASTRRQDAADQAISQGRAADPR